MATLPTQQLFTSFHTRTAQLPAEMNRLIIDHADPSLFPQDHPAAKYAPIAHVSRALRQAYIDHRRQQPCTAFGIGKRPPPLIREAVDFPDLQALLKFFTNGPGRPGQCLTHITYVRIVYRDDWAIPNWEYSVRYAYEAFELLVANLGRLRLRRLQIHVTPYTPPFDLDAPGVWSLLKIRGLQDLILTSRRGEIRPAVRHALQKRLRWPASRPWCPIGLENPGPGNWQTHVSQQGPGSVREEQYTYLDRRYKFLHDRVTADARVQEQRRVYDRRYGVRRQARAQRYKHRQHQAKMKRLALEKRRKIAPSHVI